jgi:DNA topoisomerase-3
MKLCIAEKPSVAKDLAHILGAKYRKDGYFEGNGYCVSWTFGHLCTLKEPDDYHPTLKRWRLQSLPIIPPQFGIKLIQKNGIEKQFRTIEKLVSEADSIINCGDAGQEGELIQRWVLQKANNTKPVQRLWISSLTEEAIREGFSNLKNASDFDNLYAAGSVRAIGDWLLGINATRLYTLKYGQNKQVLSIGRVQTPTLALIVNRHLEIENFTPEPYWELKTKYRDVIFSATKGRFKKDEKEKAEQALLDIKQTPFTVESFTKKKGKEFAPKLFDLTSLQVECNKKLGYSAEETLKYVQGLYEKKHVSYPRVDTSYLPNDMFPKIKGILNSLVGYASFIKPITDKPIKKTKRVFDDKKVTDHHAIIPTNVWPGGNNLMEYEKRVYDIITRRFIANFMDDCDVSKTEVIGEASKIGFKATGKQILSPGWRIIYQKDKKIEEDDDNKKEDNQTLPEFIKGESGEHQPLLGDKMTSPPKPLTEATLLRAMETAGKQIDDETLREALKENGIGRPSTRANIIETLFRRKYIVRKRKTLVPTSTGIELIGTIDNDLLKSAQLTGEWEQKMRLIERGEYEVKTFMGELKSMVTDVVTQVKTAQEKKITIIDEKEIDKPKEKKKRTKNEKEPEGPLRCPKCQLGEILKGNSAFGCSAFKSGCDFRIPFILFDKKLTETQTKTLIRKSKSPLIKGIPMNGVKKEGYFVLDDSFNIQFQEKE